MASSAVDVELPSAFAQAATQVRIVNNDAGALASQQAAGAPQQDCAAAGAQNGTADFAAAFSLFLNNPSEALESNNIPQSMLSNIQLAGVLGLLPQQQAAGQHAQGAQPQGAQPNSQDATAPQEAALKTEPTPEDSGPGNSMPDADQQDGVSRHQQHQHPHPLQLLHGPGMAAQARPGVPQGRWPPAAVAAAHWDYAAAACGMLSQQQPPGGPPPPNHQAPQQPPQAGVPPSHGQPPQQQTQHMPHPSVPSAPPSAATQGSGSTGAAPGGGHAPSAPSGCPQPSAPGQMHMQHPAMQSMRGYPYGPYGEPCPYPPHARPPPGPYHHPGMPGPPGHMMAYHPGFPPMHHVPHRAPYYPPDTRYPPMAPCHPGYPPPPPGYYRGHPGMPPHPHAHPAYYMPQPYGGPHPSMHPAMYHAGPPPGMAGPGSGQGPMDGPGGRESTLSGNSAGTAIGVGASDGGSDPVSAMRRVTKGNASMGGSESEDVGLEAVITLRPAAQEDQEGVSGEDAAAADAADGSMALVPTSCQDSKAQANNAVGTGEELLQPNGNGGPAVPPHMQKMPPSPAWPPHMMPPPPHGMGGPMPGVGVGFEWSPPHPMAMMAGYPPPGYPPPPGGWMYPGYDPMAAALHHQQLMLGGELEEDDGGGDGGLDQMPRRRLSMMGGPMGPMPPGAVMGAPPMPQHQQHMQMAARRMPYAQQMQPPDGSAMLAPKALTDEEQQQMQHMQQQPSRPGSADPQAQLLGSAASLQMQRSGSVGQLLSALGGMPDSQCYVSRRTQRLKKRRSVDLGPGATPDPFVLAVAAAERAAMGRDSSTGSGALGLPPMFPNLGGGPRRSSNGSDRTAHLCSRGSQPPSSRQRSDPGYLIEGPDQGGVWGPGGGPMGGPMAGLGQLVNYPPQLPPAPLQLFQQPQQQQLQQQVMVRRPSENGSGGGGRAITLPKRFDDAIMTLEYPKGPQPGCNAVRKPNKGPMQGQQQLGFQGGLPVPYGVRLPGMLYDPQGMMLPGAEEPQYEEEEEEEEAQEVELGNGGDDSDEDYDAGGERRGFRGGGRSVGGAMYGMGDGISRKRKAPMVREELPQPEKKRKARDPATISKVVVNCVIILRMVNQDLVYEKEIRNALGNNPDTSKALRLLMNQGKLVRTGQGGRGNPYCYRCTPLGIHTLQRIEEAATPGADPNAGPNPEQRAAAVAV